MNTEEIDERTNPLYLEQVEEDLRESGSDATADDYLACRLKIKSLNNEIAGLNHKLDLHKRFMMRVLKGVADALDVPLVREKMGEWVLRTGVYHDMEEGK